MGNKKQAICIDNESCEKFLTIGKEYTLDLIDNEYTYVIVDDSGGFNFYDILRFKIIGE